MLHTPAHTVNVVKNGNLMWARLLISTNHSLSVVEQWHFTVSSFTLFLFCLLLLIRPFFSSFFTIFNFLISYRQTEQPRIIGFYCWSPLQSRYGLKKVIQEHKKSWNFHSFIHWSEVFFCTAYFPLGVIFFCLKICFNSVTQRFHLTLNLNWIF